ncbi:hypothetical protein H2202_001278 [Exophiala xenobiotica]|nr:hypothetical protein H2202_001278 [Exophiala xenobiotica]
MAGMIIKTVCNKKDTTKIHRRREVGWLERPVGYLCKALKNSAPKQKEPIATESGEDGVACR